jgi:3-oxoadipate CoA-transferase beta subunit
MSKPQGWTQDEIAAQLAMDIPAGAYVNLGIGMPTLVGTHVPPERDVIRHSENGILGMGAPAELGDEDLDLIDASKNACTLVPGASICDHPMSFAMIRGGHIDIAVMGALQVSEYGDLANWRVEGQLMGSVGGAMDLAVGAKQVWVLMQHQDRDGRSKIVRACTFPLTCSRCVTRIYTTLAVLAVQPGGLLVLKSAPGVDDAALRAATDAPIRFSARSVL